MRQVAVDNLPATALNQKDIVKPKITNRASVERKTDVADKLRAMRMEQELRDQENARETEAAQVKNRSMANEEIVEKEVKVTTMKTDLCLNPTLLKDFDQKKGRITAMIMPQKEPPSEFGTRPGKENMTLKMGVALKQEGEEKAGGEPYRNVESGGKTRMTKTDLSRLQTADGPRSQVHSRGSQPPQTNSDHHNDSTFSLPKQGATFAQVRDSLQIQDSLLLEND